LSNRAPKDGRRLTGSARVPDRAAAVNSVQELPDGLRPAIREELFPIALAAVVVSFVSFAVCYTRGYILLYGDAVAHLGIARRVFDSRNPGLAQLGGVWLPLPHLLMLPFVRNMEWWQNGLAGAWPSMGCYILGVIGLYRLTRRMMTPRWALVATLFYGLNPNLMYLATTAMTEPLFLAELIWLTVLTMECVAAVRAGRDGRVARLLVLVAVLIVAAVLTRYEGWIVGAAAWCVVAWSLSQRRDVFARVVPSFAFFTLLTVAGPVSWLAYNQHFFHDALDFMRGPYSAAAIEKKTSPPGSRHYRGWHNPAWALLFYLRTAQVDAAVWETGFAVMAAAIYGLALAVRRRLGLVAVLLWVPLPFYLYSIAYGSVPIFIPQLWPHSYYNARYGMELLPALAVFAALALGRLDERWKTSLPLGARLLQPVTILLVVLSAVGMMYRIPLVLKEAQVNAVTRVAFEAAVARELKSLPAGVPILMYNSEHIGALQQAGIPLRQTLNEGDYDSWKAALDAPARNAAYVVAMAGDPVSQAVAGHPQGLTELTVLCTSGQPCARIYRSEIYNPAPSH
jgi:Dolichyl-phosphate-mannose-protein mannosyltransferase